MDSLRARARGHFPIWLVIILTLAFLIFSEWDDYKPHKTSHAVNGGFLPSNHPIETHPLPRAAIVPAAANVDRYVVRVHAQGVANSCVNQTIAGMLELLTNEKHVLATGHRKRVSLSSGIIWNQLNGGYDAPIGYDAAFSLATSQGDAPLKAFPYDGTFSSYFVRPTYAQIAAGTPYRIRGWHYVSPYDVAGIRSEIAAGRPLAVAFHWYAGWENRWGSNAPIVYPESYYVFDHSLLIVGYSAYGVQLLNSWGTGWGVNGREWMPWASLGAYATSMVAVNYPLPAKKNPSPSP